MTSAWRKRGETAAVYCGLATPFLWLIYRTATQDLGPQPSETLNKELGEIAIQLLLINLYWGALIALFPRAARTLRWAHRFRRPLGVATFIAAVLHFVFFVLREGDPAVAFENLSTKPYLWAGLSAFLILIPLTATSNSLSVRKLGAARWKKLHRVVHLAAILAGLHFFSIEKADIPEGVVLFTPLAILQGWRLWRSLQTPRLLQRRT